MKDTLVDMIAESIQTKIDKENEAKSQRHNFLTAIDASWLCDHLKGFTYEEKINILRSIYQSHKTSINTPTPLSE
jgi:hypothetical protein